MPQNRAPRDRGKRAALGFRAHSGWAAMVAVGSSGAVPMVIQRRRVELADRAVAGSVQPYHAAAEMKLEDAAAFLEGCAATATAMAVAGVREALAYLAERGYETVGCSVLASSGRPTGELAATLASHPAIHTAEGEFFRNALRRASESCGLPVAGIKEKELLTRGADTLGMSEDELEHRIAELGKLIGPPWRQDEKFSALSAWLVLAGR